MWLTDLWRRMRGPAPILIYGKDTCPYTTRARKAFAEQGVAFTYINVQKNERALRRLLKMTHGQRVGPVLVEGGTITIGYGGT